MTAYDTHSHGITAITGKTPCEQNWIEAYASGVCYTTFEIEIVL